MLLSFDFLHWCMRYWPVFIVPFISLLSSSSYKVTLLWLYHHCWFLYWETREQWETLFSWAPKSLADGDCSHEIKRRLLLGRKAMTNLDNVLKSRHYFANEGLFSQSYGFSSSHGCESWTIKKAFAEELMLLNCGVGEDSWESLGLQEDPTSPS